MISDNPGRARWQTSTYTTRLVRGTLWADSGSSPSSSSLSPPPSGAGLWFPSGPFTPCAITWSSLGNCNLAPQGVCGTLSKRTGFHPSVASSNQPCLGQSPGDTRVQTDVQGGREMVGGDASNPAPSQRSTSPALPCSLTCTAHRPQPGPSTAPAHLSPFTGEEAEAGDGELPSRSGAGQELGPGLVLDHPSVWMGLPSG